MAAPVSVPVTAPVPSREPKAIPAWLFNVCFVLFVLNVTFFPVAYSSH
jgi:hypothetical protein